MPTLKNNTASILAFTDLAGPQTGQSVTIPAFGQVIVYSEDLNKATSVTPYLLSGDVTILNNDEPPGSPDLVTDPKSLYDAIVALQSQVGQVIWSRPILNTVPLVGQALIYNGTAWVAATPAGGGTVIGSGLAGKVSFWTDATTISYDNQLAWDSTGKTLTSTKYAATSWVDSPLYKVSGTPLASTHLSDAASLQKKTDALSGDLSGTLAAPVVSKVNGIAVSGTPLLGYILIATGSGAASWQAPSVMTNPNASTTVKGVTKLSVAPVLSTNPIAVGDNDPRLSDSRPPNGGAGGDLSGAYPFPTVAQIQGVPVDATAPTQGQVLRYWSGEWTPDILESTELGDSATLVRGNSLVAGDLSGYVLNPSVVALRGREIDSAAPSVGQVYAWTGTKWAPANYTAIPDASDSVKGISRLSVAPASPADPVAAGDNDPRLTDSRVPSGSASGDLAGTYPGPTVAKIQGTSVSATAPTSGQVLKYDGSEWKPDSDSTAQPDASATVKGITKLSVAPVSPTNPIAAGDNDPRLTDSRTPSGAAGGDLEGTYPNPTVLKASSSIQGKVRLSVAPANPATPIAVGDNDSRLSDARTPTSHAASHENGGSDEVSVSGLSGILADPQVADKVATSGTPVSISATPPTAGQVLTASGPSAASWATPAAQPDASLTVKGLTKLSVAPVSPTDPIAAGDNDPRLTDSRTPTGSASGDLSGTYPGPTVAKLQGVAVDVTAPTSGQVLKFDGTKWAPAADAGAAFPLLAPNGTILAPSYSFLGSTGSGIAFDNGVAVTFGGVKQLEVLADRVQFFAPLMYQTGAAAGKILTSDASGFASWQPFSFPAGMTFDGTILTVTGSPSGAGIEVGSSGGGATLHLHHLVSGSNWLLNATASSTDFEIRDNIAGTIPFVLKTGMPNDLFVMNSFGVGIGAPATDSKLYVGGNIKIVDGSQAAGYVLTSDANGLASWQALPTPPAVPDASTTVKGVTKLSVAPVSPTNPIAAGDNDPRLSDARTPTAHAASHENGGTDEISVAGLSGALADPQTADKVATTGTPVSISPTPPSAGQVLTASGPAAASWAAPASPADASTTVKGITKLSVAPVSPTDPIAAGDNDPRLSDARTPTAHAASHENGGSDEISIAGLSGVAADPQVADKVATSGTPVTISPTPPTAGQVLTASGAAAASWQTPSAVPDASTTVKGVSKLSVAPVSPTEPIAAGDNDPRLSDARTPTAHAASHENGGGDEISVAGLSGVLADPQVADKIATSGTPVSISSTPPVAGDVLFALDAVSSAWSNPYDKIVTAGGQVLVDGSGNVVHI